MAGPCPSGRLPGGRTSAASAHPATRPPWPRGCPARGPSELQPARQGPRQPLHRDSRGLCRRPRRIPCLVLGDSRRRPPPALRPEHSVPFSLWSSSKCHFLRDGFWSTPRGTTPWPQALLTMTPPPWPPDVRAPCSPPGSPWSTRPAEPRPPFGSLLYLENLETCRHLAGARGEARRGEPSLLNDGWLSGYRGCRRSGHSVNRVGGSRWKAPGFRKSRRSSLALEGNVRGTRLGLR